MGTWRSALRFSIRELLLLLAIVGLVLSSYLNYSPLRYTGEPLDVAIDGDGYFCLTDERTSATVYTREGRFIVDDNGQLALRSGGKLWLVNPSICVPGGTAAVAISPSGLVLAREGKSSRAYAIGQIQLASFRRSAKLREIAPAVFQDTLGSGQATICNPGSGGVGLVCQGALCVTAY